MSKKQTRLPSNNSLRNENIQLKLSTKQLKEVIAKLEAEADSAKQTIAIAKGVVAGLEAKNKELLAQNQWLSKEVSSNNSRNYELSAKLNTLNEKYRLLENDYRYSTEARSNLERQIISLREIASGEI